MPKPLFPLLSRLSRPLSKRFAQAFLVGASFIVPIEIAYAQSTTCPSGQFLRQYGYPPVACGFVGPSGFGPIPGNTTLGNNNSGSAVPVALTPSQTRANIGLGTIATQSAAAIAITGGTISGLSSFGVANAGVFTNTQMNEYATGLLNGLSPSTEFHTVQGGNYATDALTGGIAIPNTSTVYQSNAIAAYLTNDSTVTNGVGIYSQVRSLVNNAKIWGANILADDNGFISNFSVQENDCGISNASSACNGLSLNGANTTQPSSAVGVIVGYFDTPSAPGSIAKWTTGFATGPGTAEVGLSLGQTSYTGANISSQPIYFNYFNGSGTAKVYTVQVNTGDLFITNSAGTGTAQLNIDGSIQLTQTGNLYLGADQDITSSGAGNLSIASGNTLTSVSIGNGSATVLFNGPTEFLTSSAGSGTQTFTNSPCTSLTTERWISTKINGQTGTWNIPACQ